jgi:hypothetical protein
VNYADAIDKFFSVNASLGYDHVPLGVILEANALGALGVSNLDVNGNGLLTRGGKPLAGPASSLPFILEAPGFWVSSPINDGTTPFVVDPTDPPRALRSPFSYLDIADQLGATNVEFIGRFITVMKDQLRRTNLLPPDEVDRAIAVCMAGILCIPCSHTLLENLYRPLGDMHYWPDFPKEFQSTGLAQWTKVAETFDQMRKAYVAKNYAVARDLATAAAANVELWDSIYNAVKTLRDAPAIAAGAVIGGAWDALTGNLGALFGNWKVWAALGTVGAVAVTVIVVKGKGIKAVKKAVSNAV